MAKLFLVVCLLGLSCIAVQQVEGKTTKRPTYRKPSQRIATTAKSSTTTTTTPSPINNAQNFAGIKNLVETGLEFYENVKPVIAVVNSLFKTESTAATTTSTESTTTSPTTTTTTTTTAEQPPATGEEARMEKNEVPILMARHLWPHLVSMSSSVVKNGNREDSSQVSQEDISVDSMRRFSNSGSGSSSVSGTATGNHASSPIMFFLILFSYLGVYFVMLIN